MSTSFSRSIKTLQADTSGGSLAAIILVMILLVGWLGWAFLARVPVYEVTETAVLLNATQVEANFPPDALLRLKPGQPALLRLDDFAWDTYGLVPATVTGINPVLQDGRLQVHLQLKPDPDSPIPLQAGLTGRVEIKVDQKSPAALLLETSGVRLADRAAASE